MNEEQTAQIQEERQLPPVGTEAGYRARLVRLSTTPGKNAVLAMYLADYRPVIPTRTDSVNMTSKEIIDALEDMAQLDTDSVAWAMTFLGYRMHVNDYRGLEWSMRPMDPHLDRTEENP